MINVVSEHAAGYEKERVGWMSFERPSPRSNIYFFHSLILLSIMGVEVIIDGRGRGGGGRRSAVQYERQQQLLQKKELCKHFWGDVAAYRGDYMDTTAEPPPAALAGFQTLLTI